MNNEYRIETVLPDLQKLPYMPRLALGLESGLGLGLGLGSNSWNP